MKLRRLTNQDHKTKFIEIGDVFEISAFQNSSVYMKVQLDEGIELRVNSLSEEEVSEGLLCVDLSTGKFGHICKTALKEGSISLVDAEIIVAPKKSKETRK